MKRKRAVQMAFFLPWQDSKDWDMAKVAQDFLEFQEIRFRMALNYHDFSIFKRGQDVWVEMDFRKGTTFPILLIAIFDRFFGLAGWPICTVHWEVPRWKDFCAKSAAEVRS